VRHCDPIFSSFTTTIEPNYHCSAKDCGLVSIEGTVIEAPLMHAFKCRKNIGLQQLATHWDLTFRSKSNSIKRIVEKLNLFELVKLLGKCFTTCSPMYHISRTQFGQKLNR
jgi:hypothetical protein